MSKNFLKQLLVFSIVLITGLIFVEGFAFAATNSKTAWENLITSIARLFVKFQTVIYIGAAFGLILLIITTLSGTAFETKKVLWFAVGLIVIALAGWIITAMVDEDKDNILGTFSDKAKETSVYGETIPKN